MADKEFKPSYALIVTVGSYDVQLPPDLLAEIGKGQHTTLYNAYFRIQKPGIEINILSEAEAVNFVSRVNSLADEQKRVRKWGKELWKTIEQDSSSLKMNLDSFPVLKPLLQAFDPITGEVLTNYIDYILLIATDSPEQHPGDTVYYAKIIQHYLGKLVPDLASCPIEILTLQKQANLYDEVFWELRTRLDNEYAGRLQEYDSIFISSTAGTPAMSWALLQLLARLFGEKLLTIYTDHSAF